MEITFYNNSSPNDCLNKTIGQIKTITGVFKENTPVENVEAIISYDSDILHDANYMYVSKFDRFYYCRLETLPGNRIKVTGAVDPLMSFKDEILGLSAILVNTEKTGVNKYLYDSDVFVANCKHKTNIINFPSGLLDTGEFILITAGG